MGGVYLIIRYIRVGMVTWMCQTECVTLGDNQLIDALDIEVIIEKRTPSGH